MDIFTTKKKKSLPVFKYPRAMQASFHWSIILAAFFILTLVIAGFSALIFFRISQEKLYSGNLQTGSTSKTFKPEELQELVNAFDQRSLRLETYTVTPKTVLDPSV